MKKNGIIVVVLFLSACTEPDLERSIFFPDPEFPELPKYSEWGYNTFGAYFDRQPFVSNNVEVPAKVTNDGGKTSFLLTGQKGVLPDSNPDAFSISFLLPGLQPETFDSLIVLHNSSWDLASPGVEVIVSATYPPDTVDILNGKLQFVRAQYLLVDQKAEQVILSGVFEFQAIRKGTPVTVSNGRFDVGVSDHNFFRY